MKLTDDLKKNVEIIEKNLNVGNTFDMLARIVDVIIPNFIYII